MNNLDQFNPWVPEALAGRPLKKRKENPEMLTHTYMQKARMSKYVGSKKEKRENAQDTYNRNQNTTPHW